MARAATSPELALYRAPGKWTKLRAAIFSPSTIYTARINQLFVTNDQVLEITYDTGVGTLANVLTDMTLLVGSSAGAYDVGICRIRSADATKFYISETSDIVWADNLYLTVINDFQLRAKHVLIDEGVSYMDGGIAYSDQHTNFDPTPIMGSHRCLELTGASVSATFDFSGSYVVDGSSISTYATSSPTASGGSNLSTATPTLVWNTTGWHAVYLTVTAANGKSFFGVRYVRVWDGSDPLVPVSAVTGSQDAEAGGWSFSMTLRQNVTLADVRERALVLLVAEDHWGDGSTGSIGPVVGSENIVAVGWIAEESIVWNPEAGSVSFRIQGAQHWMGRIPAYPDGVEFTSGTPAAWTQIQNLTVRLGIWHFLHWRTTATRVMDIFLTDDALYSAEVSSLASTLWEQIREMAYLQIYARTGVNAQGQLFVEVHPQLVPEVSRTWPTIMTITKGDWLGEISFDRATIQEVAAVALSGVAVNSSGLGTPYFSLSPGKSYPHYGSPESQDNLLVGSQSQANRLAGMYRNWRNNPYPDIPISLAADVRLIDCFPRQWCSLTIASGDTPRGISFSGHVVPKSVQLTFEEDSGYLHRDVSFEAETFEGQAVTHTVPGEGDRSVPPTPPLPRLPTFPVIIPGSGGGGGSTDGPTVVVMHDVNQGLLYATDFGTGSTWNFFNAGLSVAQKQNVKFFFRTPGGVCYCGKAASVAQGGFIARTTALGGTWTVLYDSNNCYYVHGANYNQLLSDTVGIALTITNGQPVYFYLGSYGSFSQKGQITSSYNFQYSLSYGLGKWLAASYGNQGSGKVRTSPDGTTWTPALVNDTDINRGHIRASTTGRTYHERAGNGLFVADNNFTSFVEITDTDIKFADSNYPDNPWMACDPSGSYIMTRYGVGSRGRSSDGGTTWALIPNLPLGNWWFDYAGPTSRFVAAGGTSVRCSLDFGNSWSNREGNLTTMIPTPDIDMIKVLAY